MNDRPLVSVVTPSLNQARFLEDTMRSVLQQDYPAVEYLIVDGGSTDGSVEVIQRHAPRLAYWVSEPDAGQSHAINKGFARARGEILTWLNADDVYVSRTVLSEIVRAFQQDASAGVVHGDYALMDTHGTLFRVVPSVRRVSFGTLASYCLGQPSTFFRGDLARRHRLREDLHYGMDYEYWLRLSQAGARFAYLPRLCSAYRVHGASKSASAERAMTKELGEIREAYFHGAWFSRWPLESAMRRSLGVWLRLRGLRRLPELYELPLAFSGRRLPRPMAYVQQLFAKTFS